MGGNSRSKASSGGTVPEHDDFQHNQGIGGRLEREQASLQTGNKYEASLDQLVRRAEAVIRTSLSTD
jgi:hypothetical protein